MSAITYNFAKLQKRIITPVNLYPVLPVTAGSIIVNALWDTGATLSAITPDIKNRLNLVPIRKKPVAGVHGTREVEIVPIIIELPNYLIKRSTEAAVCNINVDVGIILGMDVIQLGDFAICNGKGQTLFSFAIPPSNDKIDFSVRKNVP